MDLAIAEGARSGRSAEADSLLGLMYDEPISSTKWAHSRTRRAAGFSYARSMKKVLPIRARGDEPMPVAHGRAKRWG